MEFLIKPLLPSSTIGILGSGQLGRMLAVAAQQMGTKNVALLAIAILGNKYPEYREKLEQFRQAQTEKVLDDRLPVNLD